MTDIYKCNCQECGYEATFWDFYVDEFFDEELDDVVSYLQCPECGNDDIYLIEVTDD